MATAATSLLGLALPVTGELSGTWGDTVNTSITALLDSAVAGTTTLSVDADVTLTTTALAANQAREAIILWTAGGTVTRNITAPAQSKTYVVLNKTSSTQSIVIRGVGPTTGVTVLAGRQAMVAWDGTDYVEVSSGYVDGPASATDNAVARFDGTSGKTIQNSVVIIADTTGNMTGVGTLSSGAITSSSLTATRVLFAGTSGLIQDDADLTFNGTILTSTGFAGPLNGTVGATTANTGNFTTLGATGNVTLGDATTDTVTVNGYMGIGGAADSSRGVVVLSTALTGTTQTGVYSQPVVTSGATVNATGFAALVQTAASVFTVADMSAFRVAGFSKGAGSIVTNAHGLLMGDLSVGTNNFGITTQVSSGANKWNIYASGTAANYFAGNVLIGDASPSAATNALLSVGKATSSETDPLVHVFDSNDDLGLKMWQADSPDRTFNVKITTSDTANGSLAFGAQSLTSSLRFSTGTSVTYAERMRITNAGNIGIGTTNPLVKLEVAGLTGTAGTSTASIAGTTMTVTAVANGTFVVGDLIYGANIQPYTRITAFGTGTGGVGTYTVSVSQTVASTQVTRNDDYGGTVIRITNLDVTEITGQPTGGLQFYTSDSSAPTAGVGAYVAAMAESATPDTALVFGTRNDTGGGIDANERMRLDSAGNLGLGVTPSAWGGGYVALDIASRTALVAGGSADPNLVYNAYFNGTNWIYKNTTNASRYQQVSGQHQWHNAPSGTAGATVTFTQAMTLDASGNLGIGTTTPTSTLSVTGTANITGNVTLGDASTDTVTVAGTTNLGAVVNTGLGVTTGAASFELGASRTGDGTALIDFHAASGTDNEFRILRAGGVDGNVNLTNSGAGTFTLQQSGAGNILFQLNGGNVGIGTTTPASRLSSTGNSTTDFKALTLRNSSVATGSAAVLNFETSGGTEGDITSSAAQIKGVRTGAGISGALAFWTSASGVSAEQMRLDSAGNLGIGTTTPTNTLSVAGNANVTGNVTLGDAVADTITINSQFVTGTVLRAAQVATNTLALAAYDTDGVAYVNLITLTSSTTPTLALTSTGVGTINNMSIGATTASTGAFTTLSANSTVTFSGTTTNLALGTSQTTGTWIGGGTAQTGAITLGQSTVSQTINIGTGATTAVSTKAINIGTAGVSGATINIASGSATSGALVTHSWNAGVNNMRLNSAGNLGIGITLPAAKLQVSGDVILSNVDVINATYSGTSYSVISQDNTPCGVFFRPDGLRLFVMGNGTDRVLEYSLSTPWLVSSATYVAQLDVTAVDTSPQDIYFRADGLKLYVIGQTNSSIYQYSLSTPWSITTASYDSISISVIAQDTAPKALWFKPNGLVMFVTGASNDSIYQYNLTTAWNVSTAVYLQSLAVTAQDSLPNGVTFTEDGSRMFMLGASDDEVNVYQLTTPWNIATATFINRISLAAQDTNPLGFYIKPDGTKMYVAGSLNSSIYEYNVPSISIQLTGPTAIADATVSQNLTVYGASVLSGNVGIGTTSTTANPGVVIQPVGAVIIGNSAGPSGWTFNVFQRSGVTIGSITQNGTTGVLYNINSDYRLKNITGPITTSGAYIDSLKPVEGTWKADGSTFVGLIAHETQEVSRTTVATGTKDGDEMQGMDYSSAEIIANLIAELQSLRARVAQLESK